jgi:adenylate cyclase
MREGTQKLWHGLREHATHWVVGGTLLAVTGFAPEEWLAHTVHGLHIPESVLHLWSAGVDVRVVPIAIGMAVIAIGLLRQRQTVLLTAASVPSVSLAVSAGAPPVEAVSTAKTVEQSLVQGYPDALPLPDKPSIAVLAFTNMSDDPEQEYFSDGVAEDIITELSRNRLLFVIARNSSFTYKGHAVDTRQVARELGVRYVVEGSVRRDGNRIRITAQLIDAETGSHIWAERFDRDLADIFTVQDEITRAMVAALGPAISQAERQRAMQRPPENLSAWEAYQRALSHWSKGEDFSTARVFLQRAVALDPRFAPAHAMLASCYLSETSLGARSVQEGVRLAEAEARTALELDPDSAIAHAVLAWVFGFQGDQGPAMEEADAAIALDPNDPRGHMIKGRILVFSGQPAEAREFLATALRLDPRGPTALGVMVHRAIGCYFEGDYLASEAIARRAIRAYPQTPRPYAWLAAALGQLGRVDEAHAALDAGIAASPSYFEFITASRPPYYHRPKDHEHLLDGLRKAGWQG